MSWIEAATNVVVGWWLAHAMELAMFPAIGLQVTLSQNILVSSTFTLASLFRSYVLRRIFTRLSGGG
ncbi:hypothetical protein [Oceanicola sp. 22II-s10i]|uniref:DUF7220 family protein n=1 Tax=Oceanicola sp. 22II-s10i TaxID=1317116 RepID=UPI0020CE1469|nr:hypothetical protein [Oceanicola sp. 22II-s10i]